MTDRKRIAVVEQDPDMAEVLRVLLEDCSDYRVTSYASPAHFLDALTDGAPAPDCLIASPFLYNRVHTGIGLIAQMERRYPAVSTILISGSLKEAEKVAITQGIQPGACLKKPFEPLDLLSLLKDLVE